MNEKLVRLTCYGMVFVVTGEAGALGIHYQQNLECLPPVNEAGCLPAAPKWSLTPHPEQNSNYTSSAAAAMSTIMSASGPTGITGVVVLQEAPDRSR